MKASGVVSWRDTFENTPSSLGTERVKVKNPVGIDPEEKSK
jgi:hypothetical protein